MSKQTLSRNIMKMVATSGRTTVTTVLPMTMEQALERFSPFGVHRELYDMSTDIDGIFAPIATAKTVARIVRRMRAA